MDDLDELSDEFRSELFKLASASRKHRRLENEVMKGCWYNSVTDMTYPLLCLKHCWSGKRKVFAREDRPGMLFR